MTDEKRQDIIDAYIELGTYEKVREKLKCSYNTIWKVITDAGLNKGKGGNQASQIKITDDELLKAVKSMTTKEIADTYHIHETNVLRRCKKLGVKPLDSGDQLSGLRENWGKHNENLRNHGFGECWHYVSSFADSIKDKQPDFEYLETQNKGKTKRVRLKCKYCGTIIERATASVRRNNIKCDYCFYQLKEDNQLQEERLKLIRTLIAIKEIRSPKICCICEKEYFTQFSYSKYCSQRCKAKAKRDRYRIKYGRSKRKSLGASHYLSRARKFGVEYEYGVTLKSVIKRDKGICQICGKVCNPNDKRWGSFGPDYPTLDHIIPLSKGGPHTWDNVQCACGNCNSYKRDLITG